MGALAEAEELVYSFWSCTVKLMVTAKVYSKVTETPTYKCSVQTMDCGWQPLPVGIVAFREQKALGIDIVNTVRTLLMVAHGYVIFGPTE